MGVSESVSPFQAFLWSVGAFSFGAFVAGTLSFRQGTQQSTPFRFLSLDLRFRLETEGVDPRTRAKILPTAAFGVGTGIVLGVSALGTPASYELHSGALQEEVKNAFQAQVERIRVTQSEKHKP